ncbi:hypothetical protein BH18ACT7_BH18ACT7_15450 [soil metagenome]
MGLYIMQILFNQSKHISEWIFDSSHFDAAYFCNIANHFGVIISQGSHAIIYLVHFPIGY